ncbi:hypothetical protein [Acinetobacter guillouiae]|uniref:hypothetical protein n=1 Tax=Acinetobacter guillouiae TaxID=106649 RepID=UPI003C6EE62D
MKFINVGIENFKIGISISENCDIDIHDMKFRKVETCFEIRKAHLKNGESPKELLSSSKTEREHKENIKKLFNLEVVLKKNKSQHKLNLLKKLKGTNGSKDFENQYQDLLK